MTSFCVRVVPSAVRRTVYAPGGAAGPFVLAPQRIIPGKVVTPVVRRSHDRRLRPATLGSGVAAKRRPPPPPAAAALSAARAAGGVVSGSNLRTTTPLLSTISSSARLAGAFTHQLIVVPGPDRTPTGGAKSHASAAVTSGLAWRSGAMLSSTQKPRPCVEITSSFPSTTRSETGTSGRLRDSDCQLAPSSYER